MPLPGMVCADRYETIVDSIWYENSKFVKRNFGSFYEVSENKQQVVLVPWDTEIGKYETRL